MTIHHLTLFMCVCVFFKVKLVLIREPHTGKQSTNPSVIYPESLETRGAVDSKVSAKVSPVYLMSHKPLALRIGCHPHHQKLLKYNKI